MYCNYSHHELNCFHFVTSFEICRGILHVCLLAFLRSLRFDIFVTDFDFRASIDFNNDGLYPRMPNYMQPCGVTKVLLELFFLKEKLVPVPPT